MHSPSRPPDARTRRNSAKRYYDQAKTPYQRVLDAPEAADEVKERQRQQYLTLNPAELLRTTEHRLAALWKLANKPATAPMP